MDQPTPLLRWDRALLKLEMFAPAASVWGRAAAGARGPLAASGNAALALAELAPGVELALLEPATHEMREALKIWGARMVPEAPPWRPEPALFARTLGAELLEQLAEPPPLLVCPAGALPALQGALAALRQRWPQIRAVALFSADEELPELP